MTFSTVSHIHDASVPAALDVDRRLCEQYQALTHSDGIRWQRSFRILRLLGRGGQGIVFLGESVGSDSFTLPVALKFFSPESYRDDDAYRDDMRNIARSARQVALIQHDNLLDIHNFVEQDGIRIMEMEWVDGFNLHDLLTVEMLIRTRTNLPKERSDYVERVILAPGPTHPRLQPGIAIQILRECLAGLGALHREGIVHGDIKPSNIMLKRTGNAKIIDIGSATMLGKPAARRMWSPMYAAPEVLKGEPNSPQADLASLGYVLLEMLSGACPFDGLTTIDALHEAKKKLDSRLVDILPKQVASNEMLLHLCKKLVAFDPAKRFQTAQAADLDRKGASDFHRQLVKGDLASEYENDLRNWLEPLD